MAKTYLEHMCAECLEKTPAECTSEEIEKVKEILDMGGWKKHDAIIPSDECFTCSICGEPFENEDSYNARPVNDGRCCIMCNAKVVIPARLEIEKER